MNLSNEIELMIACARVCVNGEVEQKIQRFARENIDWNKFIKICVRHKVLPLVFENLSVMGKDFFPENLMTELENNYIFENAVHNLSLIEQLFFILELLKENKITAVPFKGPVLAENVLGNCTLRRSTDLDFFISKKDAAKAVDILMGKGFEFMDCPLPKGITKRVYIETLTAVSLILPGRQIAIDLQWDISNRFLNTPIILEDMTGRIEKTVLNQKLVPSLPGEELLCYLCLHGTKHRWLYLDLVCCVSEFVRARKDIDWEYTLAYAEKMHCTKVLLLGLFLARDLLEAVVPEIVDQKIDQDKQIKLLALKAYEGLFLNYLEAHRIPEKFDSFLLQVKDGFFDKIRYGTRIIFLPTKEDLRCFGLPGFLSFLYCVLRPFRLVIEYGKRWRI